MTLLERVVERRVATRNSVLRAGTIKFDGGSIIARRIELHGGHGSTILGAFEQAQTELVGKAVILTDGKAGTVENV
jgi:hypothetical protein